MTHFSTGNIKNINFLYNYFNFNKKLNLIYDTYFLKINMAIQVHNSYEMLIHPEGRQHIFLRIANTIYQNMGVAELQTFRTKLKTFESDMLILTSKINRVKTCERNQTKFSIIENGIRIQVPIEMAKSIIAKELSDNLNQFIEYLNNTCWQVNAMTCEVIRLFNNLKENDLIRDYTTQMFSNAELNLSSIIEDVNKFTDQVLLKEQTIRSRESSINWSVTNKLYQALPCLSFIAAVFFCPKWSSTTNDVYHLD